MVFGYLLYVLEMGRYAKLPTEHCIYVAILSEQKKQKTKQNIISYLLVQMWIKCSNKSPEQITYSFQK